MFQERHCRRCGDQGCHWGGCFLALHYCWWEEILHQLIDRYSIPIFLCFFCIPGGAGFLPSTVRHPTADGESWWSSLNLKKVKENIAWTLHLLLEVMWSWSNKCVIEANPTTWSQEAADWALNHPPAPISKREVHKTNRHGFGSSTSGIIKWDPIWFRSNLMHYTNTWCVTYILDICSLPPTSICKTLKKPMAAWDGGVFSTIPYMTEPKPATRQQVHGRRRWLGIGFEHRRQRCAVDDRTKVGIPNPHKGMGWSDDRSIYIPKHKQPGEGGNGWYVYRS